MKIEGVNHPPDMVKQAGATPAEKTRQDHNTPEENGKVSQGGGESVHLSERAKHILRAQKELENIPDIRLERVNQIKEQIANGTYEVNGRKIAEKIIYESIFSLIA